MRDDATESAVLAGSAAPLLARVADRGQAWTPFCWYWGDAVLVDGLLQADDAGAGAYRAGVVETLARWQRHCPPNFDDALAPGRTAIRLVMDGELDAAVAHRVLQALSGLPLIHGQIPALEPHRRFDRFGVCVDALYHLPTTLAMAARWRDDDTLLRRAATVAGEILDVLSCPGGLAQWYDAGLRRNNAVPWSRGLGWAVLGLLDLLDILAPEPAPALEDAATKLLRRLADTQDARGHWRTVLEDPRAAYETSTAAFYVAAALHPTSARLVDLSDDVLERAVAAVLRSVDAEGTYQGASADVLPAWDVATYMRPALEPSPWAQGAALRALASLACSDRGLPALADRSREGRG